VRRKKGYVLADLAHPGDEVLVARGGQARVSCLMSSCIVVLECLNPGSLNFDFYHPMRLVLSENFNNYAKSHVLCVSNSRPKLFHMGSTNSMALVNIPR
jgi:hypothetical protein